MILIFPALCALSFFSHIDSEHNGQSGSRIVLGMPAMRTVHLRSDTFLMATPLWGHDMASIRKNPISVSYHSKAELTSGINKLWFLAYICPSQHRSAHRGAIFCPFIGAFKSESVVLLVEGQKLTHFIHFLFYRVCVSVYWQHCWLVKVDDNNANFTLGMQYIELELSCCRAKDGKTWLNLRLECVNLARISFKRLSSISSLYFATFHSVLIEKTRYAPLLQETILPVKEMEPWRVWIT